MKRSNIEFHYQVIKVAEFVTDQHYNAILMIIDRFTKYTYLISFYEDYGAKQLKCVILNRLI